MAISALIKPTFLLSPMAASEIRPSRIILAYQEEVSDRVSHSVTTTRFLAGYTR